MSTNVSHLDYAPAVPLDGARIVKRIFKILGVVALLGYVVAAFFPAYGTISVCTQCGELVRMTEFRLPFTPIALYQSHSHDPSAFSRVVNKHGMAANHTDQLAFVHGGGRSMFAAGCELGSRRHLMNVVENAEIAAFLDDVLAFTDRKMGQLWIDRLLALDSHAECFVTLDMTGFPSGGFGNASAFLKWWKDHEAEMIAATGG